MQVAIVPNAPITAGLGWATHIDQMAKGLRGRGHVVTLPVVGAGGQAARIAGFARLWQGPARPDVVLVELADAEGQAAAAAAQRLGIPLVTSFHDLEAAVPPERRARVWAAVVAFHQRGRATIVKAPALAARLSAAGIAPLFVRGAGVDRARFHPGRRRQALRDAWGAAGDAPVLLTVGKLLPRKHPELLIRVLDAVRADIPAMRAVIVGDDAVGGSIGARLAAALPWAVMAGKVVGDDLADIYASADLFVLPSQSEVWPHVLFEASASGLACVAFDRGDDLAKTLAMAQIASGDEAAFIAETLRLARDAPLRRARGAAALQAASAHDWARVVDQVEAALMEAIKAPTAAAAPPAPPRPTRAAPAAQPPDGATARRPAPGFTALRASWSPDTALSLYIIDGIQPGALGGAAAIAARLRAGLQARGHAVAWEPGAVMPTSGVAEARAWATAERTRLQQAWTLRRPQVVHLELLSAFSTLALEVATGIGIPVTSAWHQVPFYSGGAAGGGGDGAGNPADPTAGKAARVLRIARDFHQRSALTFVPTEAAAEALASGGPTGAGLRCVVAPYGVDRARFAPRARDPLLRWSWGAKDATPVVLSSGRLVPEKDPAMLAAAMQAARAAGAVTVIAGEGPARAELEAALPGTIFTGRLEGDAYAAAVASADIFVHPGVVDLIAQVELEAMAAGLALVGFARPHGDRIVRDGVNAVTVAMQERAAYPAAVAALVRDLPRARKLGAAACAAMAGRTWERWLDAIEAAWRTLAQARAGGAGR